MLQKKPLSIFTNRFICITHKKVAQILDRSNIMDIIRNVLIEQGETRYIVNIEKYWGTIITINPRYNNLIKNCMPESLTERLLLPSH